MQWPLDKGKGNNAFCYRLTETKASSIIIIDSSFFSHIFRFQFGPLAKEIGMISFLQYGYFTY